MRARSVVAGLALLAAGCQGSCDFRCHTRHQEVSYRDAYVTTGQSCVTVSVDPPQEICVPYDTYHPAQCVVGDVCDVRCRDLDQGRAEAHEQHAPRRTALVNLSPQLCTDGGRVR